MANSALHIVLSGCFATVLALAGCGNDLEECDRAAAEEIVFSRQGLVATKGQALMHDSCGNGAFCHSAAATGDSRHGVPASMNFDVLPVPTGWPKIMEKRDDIWDEVLSGHMPPGDKGAEVLGDGEWMFDYRREDGVHLPKLSTRDGKAALRNWLACDAPLVSQTMLPVWTRQRSSSGGLDAGPDEVVDFDAIYTGILKPYCAVAGCHNSSAAGTLVMQDACGAYKALKQSGPCGMPRITPGDAGSLLINKLEASTPRCGDKMPPTGQLATVDVLAIRNWIANGATGPADCQ